jgi:3-oxoacyl-[acyl-carrier protein] reductase
MASAHRSRSILVIGGSRGIGAAIVERFAREDARIAFTFVSRSEEAERTATRARASGATVLSIRADSADAAAIQDAVEKAAGAHGGIDVLVVSAGVAAMAPVETFALADLDRTLAVNLRGVFIAIQAAAKHMSKGGRIVTIGSCNAERMPFQGGSVYAMSKAGLVGLVKGLSRDLGPRGITVNNVQPGPVDTDMNPAQGDFADMLRGFLAVGRYGEGDEIAALVAFLASPDAAFITGASLAIDGGFTA